MPGKRTAEIGLAFGQRETHLRAGWASSPQGSHEWQPEPAGHGRGELLRLVVATGELAAPVEGDWNHDLGSRCLEGDTRGETLGEASG
ncbi:MAG: hypothetical protein OES47_10660 [Acidobacteriota bacterium]|nr:hypothetical protein [Acidobacteriota bacterium]